MAIEREMGWTLHPLKGETGKAYMGTKDEQKLFFKKNTSPFLAALSMEGIAPKLVWTRRMGNGDVLTAQEWCKGRTLTKEEMKLAEGPHKLHRVHQSKTLKKMLQQVDGSYLKPGDLLDQFLQGLASDLESHPTIQEGLAYLQSQASSQLDKEDLVVCHGDASHKNWLLSDFDDLYLVDWDSVILADPAYDLGQYGARYWQYLDWEDWLNHYQAKLSSSFKRRIYWYQVIAALLDIKVFYEKRRMPAMNHGIKSLAQMLTIGPEGN